MLEVRQKGRPGSESHEGMNRNIRIGKSGIGTIPSLEITKKEVTNKEVTNKEIDEQRNDATFLEWLAERRNDA